MTSEGFVSSHGLSGVTEEAYLRCIRCGACAYTCPTFRVNLSQAYSPRGRVALLRAACQGDVELGANFGAKFYSCTLCGACTQACPSGVEVDELLLRAREELAAQSLLAPGLARLGEMIRENHNISGEDNALRLIWAENLERAPRGAARAHAEVVYFVGCVGSLFPRSFSIPQAFVQTLGAAEVDYALLGGDEWCCGFPLLVNGLLPEAKESILHNVARVRDMAASTVVFTCPSCFHLWHHVYPGIAGIEMEGLETLHATEFLASMVGDGRLRFREMNEVVTYHDPCDLGRRSEIYEAPRQVLQGIPGLTVVEMSDNRANALCCGGGGNLETFDPGLVAAASARRLAQAQATGARTIVSACQQCERTLANASRRERASLRVMDLTELVWRALKP